MKKYKFKLEALLKMRKLREDESKMRIGRLQTKKLELEDSVRKQEGGIDQAYESQEATVAKGGATGLDLSFYPYFVQGKRAAIGKLQEEIAALDDLLARSYEELKGLRAKTKVLEEMKEKDKKARKKEMNKKSYQKIEEQVMNWSLLQKRMEK
ncbi:MAG: flagellar FliJ family protein [Bacteriovoracaceae bacterium]